MRQNQSKRASRTTQLNQKRNNQTHVGKSKSPVANIVLGVVTASLLGLVATISSVLITSGSTTHSAKALDLGNGAVASSSILTRVSESSKIKHDKPAQAELITTTVVTAEAEEATDSDYIEYTVQAGDSFDGISTKFFGDSSGIKSILQQNNLTETSVLHPGQVLTFYLSYVVQEVDEVEVSAETPESSQQTEVTPPVEAPKPVEMTWEGLGLGSYKVVAGALDEQTRIAVLMELQNRTGASYKDWAYIISRESGWLPTVKNYLGYYGLFQLAPGYLGYDADVSSQIEGAIYLYNNGGFQHWAL
jgi:LysM repeat protein